MRLIRNIALFILLYTPALAFAAILDVAPTDKSMQYLGQIFGAMGSLPLTASGNPLIANLYYLFNEIVFALAIVIVIVTTVIGTINTAQEGEALGKKMSTVWIPARAGIGIFLLLPSVGNYNWIQITVMWLIVQGVGAANALWSQTLDSLSKDGSVVADTRKVDVSNMMTGLTSIFKSVVCMQLINDKVVNDTAVANNMDNQFIEITQLPDESGIQFARGGAPASEPPLCGKILIPSISANPLNGSTDPDDPVVAARRQIYLDAIYQAATAMMPSADEAIANPNSSTWNFSNTWVSAARALRGAVEAATAPTTSALSSLPSEIQNLLPVSGDADGYARAKADGWIHAGNYYGQMVRTGSYKTISISFGSGSTSPNAAEIRKVLGDTTANDIIYKYNLLGGTGAGSYKAYVDTIEVITPKAAAAGGKLDANGNPIGLQAITLGSTAPSDGQAASVANAVFGGSFFKDAAADMGEAISTGCLSNSTDVEDQVSDPIECMATFGAKMANAAEMAFWIAMAVVLGIWLGVSVFKACQPLGHAFDMMLSILMPIAAVILLIVWGAGLTLAIYVPLIPLLVFTFSAITWVLLVIESMLGAPLIALTLIIPSEDEIGKAGHAIVILLGLFLRPALMILGFIFAQKLLMVAVSILNFGFQGAMKMSIVGDVGPFGFVAILVMYVAIATSLVHESFSLIYVLPDKVLRWMGAAGEGSEAGQHAKEMEGAHEKGAGIGKGIMKGGLDAGSKAAS